MQFKAIAIKAAREAGKILMNNPGKIQSVEPTSLEL